MTSRPTVVCVGANLESEIMLQGLLEAGAAVVGLITVPAGEARAICDYVDLHPLCARHQVACIDTHDINAAATVEALRALAPDYLFILGWSQIVRAEVLDIPRHFAVGTHPTALPFGRGRAPIPWTILDGLRETAVTIFRVAPGVDAGAILEQVSFTVPQDARAMDLYRAVAQHLRDAYVTLYGRLVDGKHEERRQDEGQASYRAGRLPCDGHIDFTQPARAIDALVRAVSEPYPGAYTYVGDRRLHVWRSSLDDLPPMKGVPGQVLARRDGRWLVQAGDGPLWLAELTDDGVRVEPATIGIGARFGYNLADEIYALRARVARLERGADQDDG